MSRVYSVKEINHYIKGLFQEDFLLDRVTVRGEVSNLKDHTTSGHLYFTLKDSESAISAVMFRQDRRTGEKAALQNGMKALVTGSVSVYEQGGTYQIYAKTVEPDGEGELYLRFLKLKEKLEDEGLFSPIYKKPIPKYALTVGVVTAETGAAIHDVIRVARQRNPYVKIILSPALVQGDGAPQSIVRAIERLDAIRPDVMIVGRGGGSGEDLNAFNDEAVARAIFNCDTPVISAVGHEVDVTIADFVADERAATPSQAAERAVFEYDALMERFRIALERSKRSIESRCAYLKSETGRMNAKLHAVHPKNLIQARQMTLIRLEERIRASMKLRSDEKRNTLNVLTARIEGNSPLKKLTNGYGYLSKDGHPVSSAGGVTLGDRLKLTLHDGEIESVVSGVRGNHQDGT